MSGHPVHDPDPDALVLLTDLCRLGKQMPRLMVPAEFAMVGPVLNLMIGGRSGAPVYRAALHLDTERYIPAYRATLAALVRGLPGQRHLMDLVDRAIRHDLVENDHLLAALDRLDPPDGAAAQVHAATRYTLPAARHAAAKFALLAPAVLPALPVAATLALRRVIALR
jgi:hypothetical protein